MDTTRSRHRTAVVGCALAALCGSFLVVAAPAGAGPQEDKARVEAELARTASTLEAATDRAKRAAADLATANAELPAARTALADARAKLALAQVSARQADRDYAAAEAAHSMANTAYTEAAAEVDAARKRVGAFVAAAYQGGGFLALNSILDSGSPSELATRIGYLDQVAANERRALDALTSARMRAKIRANEADVARQRAETAQKAAQDALITAETATASAQWAADSVQKLADLRERSLAAAEQERTAVLARYRELKAESARIADALRAAARARSGGAPRPGVGGRFMMPTAGWKSSDFGMRFDPYYHVWQLHAGVDIAAGMGQPIYAAADGDVVYSGWSGGYGNYTCISHGGNLATCYGHQSAILVSSGQSVRRGHVIGRIGSTGASTGAHLHFEVRRGGDPVDPIPFLPACLCL